MFLKKGKNLNSRGSRYFTSGDARRNYLYIHLFKPSNCMTAFSDLTGTPSRKYIYFWKTMINAAAKSILVQLCYYMTREIPSTFSIINLQTSIPTEKCRKLAQRSCGRVGKWKYNLNGISTTLVVNFVENSSPFLSFLKYSYWPVKDRELEPREAANVHTWKKAPLGCLNLILQRKNLLMLTVVLLWCHQLPFEWWKDSVGRPAFRKRTSIYFAASPTACQVHNGRHPFSDIYKKKTLSISGQGQQPVSPKLLLYFFCLWTTNIAEMFPFHWQFSFLFVVLLFNVWIFQFLPDQLTRS